MGSLGLVWWKELLEETDIGEKKLKRMLMFLLSKNLIERFLPTKKYNDNCGSVGWSCIRDVLVGAVLICSQYMCKRE